MNKTIEQKYQLAIEYHEEADEQGRWPKHSYVNKETGKLWAGVSSVAKCAADDSLNSILNQWAANCAIADVSNRWDIAKQYTEEEKNEILFAPKTGAKTAHLRNSKEAKEIGTATHEILELYIKSKIAGKEHIFDFPNKDIARAVSQFLNWEKENSVKWLASELLVENKELEVGGRLDALALVNGKKTIVDFKVANNIGKSYFCQLAGYWLCVESMGWTPEERILVRIPKTETRKVWDSVTRKYNIVENNLEIFTPSTELSFDKEVFKHLRQVFRWQNQVALRNY